MSLFGETEDPNNERDEKLEKTLDSIRSCFGSSIVRRGTVMRSGLNNTIKPAYNNNAAEKAAIKIENPYSIISLLYALWAND